MTEWHTNIYYNIYEKCITERVGKSDILTLIFNIKMSYWKLCKWKSVKEWHTDTDIFIKKSYWKLCNWNSVKEWHIDIYYKERLLKVVKLKECERLTHWNLYLWKRWAMESFVNENVRKSDTLNMTFIRKMGNWKLCNWKRANQWQTESYYKEGLLKVEKLKKVNEWHIENDIYYKDALLKVVLLKYCEIVSHWYLLQRWSLKDV